MGQVYEDLYQHLISEGIEDSVATSVVNRMYQNEELHNVEVLDESVFRAATAIGKMMFRGPGRKLAAQIGTGHKATRAMGYATMRQGQAFAQGLGLTGQSGAMTRRGLRAAWTPSRALPTSTSGKPFISRTERATQKILDAAKGKTNVGPATPVGGKPPEHIIKALPSTGQTASRRNLARQRLDVAARGTQGSGVTVGQSGTKALPAAGEATTKQNLAMKKLDAALKGTKGAGVTVGRSKDFPTKVEKIKTALTTAGGTTASFLRKNKVPLAVGAGVVATAAGLSALTGGSTKKADTAPTTPKNDTVADKGETYQDRVDVTTAKIQAAFDRGNIKNPFETKASETKKEEPKTEKPKEKETEKETPKKRFDIRDRDIRARASYDPRFDKRRR